MHRRNFSTKAIYAVSSGLLMSLAGGPAVGATRTEEADPVARGATKSQEQSEKKGETGKNQEQSAKAPGAVKNQESSKKSPASGKAMEAESKSPMPDNKLRQEKAGQGALYRPQELDRKRFLALQHLSARRLG